MRYIIILIITFILVTMAFTQNPKKLYPLSNGKKYCLVNRKKDIIVGFKFDLVLPFREGFAITKIDNKYGIVNYKGNEIIKPIYDKIEYPYKGYIVASIADSCTIMDTLGHNLNNQWYYKVDSMSDNIIRVVNKVKTGGNFIRNTIKAYNLEKEIGLARDSVFFSEYLVGYILGDKPKFEGLWFSGGEKFINGKAKIAISKHTYFLDVLGNITPRKPDECDNALMNVFIPDEYPEFPGGWPSFNEEFNKHFIFPEPRDVHYHNVKVGISFIIDKNGNIQLPIIEKSLSAAYDAAVIKALKAMQAFKWKPAKYDEVAICFRISYSIKFSLKSF